jgi:hypothetical protein
MSKEHRRSAYTSVAQKRWLVCPGVQDSERAYGSFRVALNVLFYNSRYKSDSLHNGRDRLACRHVCVAF